MARPRPASDLDTALTSRRMTASPPPQRELAGAGRAAGESALRPGWRLLRRRLALLGDGDELGADCYGSAAMIAPYYGYFSSGSMRASRRSRRESTTYPGIFQQSVAPPSCRQTIAAARSCSALSVAARRLSESPHSSNQTPLCSGAVLLP